MTQQPHTRAEELPDEYFNTPVYNGNTGEIERLKKDSETNDIIITSANGERKLDQLDANEFANIEDLYIQIPQPAVDNPVRFINTVLDGGNNLGVVGMYRDIGLQYARSQTEIVSTDG
jgi:hypothetical protein